MHLNSPNYKTKKIDKKLLQVHLNQECEDNLCNIIHSLNLESKSNTPDFILARYILNSLEAFNSAFQTRWACINKEHVDHEKKTKFEKELISWINEFLLYADSSMPDFVIAKYLNGCLLVFNKASK